MKSPKVEPPEENTKPGGHMIRRWTLHGKGCSLFTKHDLQILYTLWVAITLASESLFYDGGLALLYLQYTSLNGVRNLPVHVGIDNPQQMTMITHYELLDVNGFLLPDTMDTINGYSKYQYH